jgi:hypothetical protein
MWRIAVSGPHEFQAGRMIEKLDQWVVALIQIEQHDRLVELSELLFDDDLEELIQRADAAGQDEEGIAERQQPSLAFAHIGHDLYTFAAIQRRFQVPQEFGEDACHLRAAIAGRPCRLAHQP